MCPGWRQPRVAEAVSELQEKGVDLQILAMGIDTATPTGAVTFHILAARAEFERELITERTPRGSGRGPGSGTQRWSAQRFGHDDAFAAWAFARRSVQPGATTGTSRSGVVPYYDDRAAVAGLVGWEEDGG